MLSKKIEELETNPKINKQLREAWKIVYPYGTIPRKTMEMKAEVIEFIEQYELGTNSEHIERYKESFIAYLKKMVE